MDSTRYKNDEDLDLFIKQQVYIYTMTNVKSNDNGAILGYYI